MPAAQQFFVVQHQGDERIEFDVTSLGRAVHMCRHLRLLYRNFPVSIHCRNSNSKEKSSARAG